MTKTGTAKIVLKDLYGIDADLTRLYGELDDNFLAVTADGDKRVLKIMHTGCDPQRVDLQSAAMSHLANSGIELNLPEVIPTTAGQAYNESNVDGVDRIVWSLKYCPGTLFQNASPHTDALLKSFGRTMALVDLSLESFTHPAMKQRHKWELTRAGAVRPFVKYIAGEAAAAQVDAALGHFESVTSSRLASLPQSVIHNDANDSNVLVNDGDDGYAVVDGLIDFGDMSYQPIICEAAIALADVTIDKDDPVPACATFLAAYNELYPLNSAEIAVLYDLIMTRLAVSIAIVSERHHEDPDDQLGQQDKRPTIRALTRLGACSSDEAERLFLQACGMI